MATADVFPADRDAKALIREYVRAQRTIVRQVRVALAEGNLHRAENRRRQLHALTDLLDRIGAPLEQEAARIVADIYHQSDELAVKRLQRLGMTVTADTFTGISLEAVQTMQAAILDRLSEARRTVGRQIDDVFARAGRRTVLQALLGAEGSPRAAAAALQQDLAAHGVTAFTDRAGRRWALGDYADMAVRTTTREAVVEAAKLRMASSGVNLARVTTHASACPVCQPWENRLVSLDGTISDLDGEPVATLDALPNGGPPLHPRCRHSLMPVVPAFNAVRAAA